MRAMIIAAGHGKRMRPLSDETPKPLLKIGRYRLIEYHLLKLAAAGFEEVIINTYHLADQFEPALGDGSNYGIPIRYSHETRLMGTGGGVAQAMPLLGAQPFIVISGDIWTDYNFKSLMSHTLTGLAHIVLVDNPDYYPEGDFALVDNQVIATNAQPKLTYGAIGLFDPRFYTESIYWTDPLEPFSIGPPLTDAANEHALTGEYYQGVWQNIGTPEQLTALRSLAL